MLDDGGEYVVVACFQLLWGYVDDSTNSEEHKLRGIDDVIFEFGLDDEVDVFVVFVGKGLSL